MLHGLRHTFASILASSGKVDMYLLQKLLTHKSPTMTQRYAHLRDETLRNAADVAGDIFEKIGKKKERVVSLSDRKDD
jgi:integrase